MAENENHGLTPHCIRAELERILSSPEFRLARRSRGFLRYTVEETLGGRSDRIKGLAIAMDVFGKSADFDSMTDPVVRVEARRLRARLASYYAADGRKNPLRISIPVGTYVPEFTVASDEQSAAVGQDVDGSIEVQAPRAPVPRITVAKVANLTNNRALDSFVAGLEAEIRVGLNTSGLPVVLMTEPADKGLGSLLLSSVKRSARYLLAASVRQERQKIRVSAQLVELSTGVQVWARSFDEDVEETESISVQEKISTRIVATLANPFGPMYEREILNLAELPCEKLDIYGCVLRFRAYMKSLDAEAHECSRRCLRRVASEQPQISQIWAGLAITHLHEHWYGYGARDSDSDSLQHAEVAARRALDLDYENLLANLAMAEVHYSKGEIQRFHIAADRAMTLEYNPSTLAQIGFLMTLAGEADHGRALLDEALASEPGIPTWYFIAHSFNSIARNEYDEALEWALRLNSSHWFPGPLAAAVAAGLGGHEAAASDALERLRVADAHFASRADLLINNWVQDPRLAKRILEGLRIAGLDAQ